MTRLPLDVGVSALRNLAYGTLALPIGLALILAAVAFAVWAGDGGDALGYIVGAGIAGVSAGYYYLRRAWRGRPSDAVLGPEGLTIDGGAHHGRVFAWSSLDPARCAVVARFKPSKPKEPAGYALQLAERDAAPVDVALMDDDGDLASARELLAAILARVERGRDVPVEAHAAPAEAAVRPAADRRRARAGVDAAAARATVLACPGCGAPVAPSELEHVRCPTCATTVPMPADVRERVRAALLLPREERRAERTVARLLDQPGAQRTALTLAASLALIGAAWPVAIAGTIHLARTDALTFVRGLALVAMPFLLIADGFFLSRLRLVDRRALATLAFGFGARPPASPGGPPSCHACGAPLRAADTTVVRCVFCGVANLLGVDLRAHASRTAAAATSLDDALAARARERRRWRLRTLASLPLFALTVLALRAVW